MKKRRLYAIVLALVSAVVLIAQATIAGDMTAKDMVAEAKKTVCEVSVSEANALFEQGGRLFVDCRTSKEFKMGHIPGAMNIPRGLLEFKVGSKIPDKNTEVVMYCKKGGRGCLATCTLCRMGYKNASNMNGGWMAWEKAGYPVE
jgi:rhodanese-related sulfurtransferase